MCGVPPIDRMLMGGEGNERQYSDQTTVRPRTGFHRIPGRLRGRGAVLGGASPGGDPVGQSHDAAAWRAGGRRERRSPATRRVYLAAFDAKRLSVAAALSPDR